MHPMGHCTICNRGHRGPRSQPYAPGDSSGATVTPQLLRVGVLEACALRLVEAPSSSTENTSSVCVYCYETFGDLGTREFIQWGDNDRGSKFQWFR